MNDHEVWGHPCVEVMNCASNVEFMSSRVCGMWHQFGLSGLRKKAGKVAAARDRT